MAFGSSGAILRVDSHPRHDRRRGDRRGLLPPLPRGQGPCRLPPAPGDADRADPLGPTTCSSSPRVSSPAPLSTATRFSAIARSPLTGGCPGSPRPAATGAPSWRWRGSTRSSSRRSPGAGLAVDPCGRCGRDPRRAGALGPNLPPAVQVAGIKEAVGEKAARVLQIGRAGENLVPYAMIMNELRHKRPDRDGRRAMGSKNLRAIAVKVPGPTARPRSQGRWPRSASGCRRPSPSTRRAGTCARRDAPGSRNGPATRPGSCPPGTSGRGPLSRSRGSAGTAYEAIRSGPAPATPAPSGASPRPRSRAATALTDTYDGPEYEAIAGFGSSGAIFDIESSRAPTSCATSSGWTSSPPRSRSSWNARAWASSGRRISMAWTCASDRRGAAGGDPAHRRPARRAGELLALGSRRIAERVGGGSAAFATAGEGPRGEYHEPTPKWASRSAMPRTRRARTTSSPSTIRSS